MVLRKMSKHERYHEGKKGLFVEVRNNDMAGAIRNLARKVKADGLLKDLRARETYEKPSVKRRRKMAEAVARHRKTLETQEI